MSKSSVKFKKHSQFWQPTPLTPDFANQVLELEMRIDTEKSIEALKALLELYSQAIEYYEAIGDARYKYFKDRMLDVLCTKEELFTPKTLQKSRTNCKLLPQREAENLLKKHETRSHNTSKQLQSNIESQAAALNKKLNIRRIRRLRSTSPDKWVAHTEKLEKSVAVTEKERNESDMSGGPNVNTEFEKALENVIERTLIQKLQKVRKIKRKYVECREDMLTEQKPEGIIKDVLSQMDLNMKKEISEVETQSETHKIVEIKKLKERFTRNIR